MAKQGKGRALPETNVLDKGGVTIAPQSDERQPMKERVGFTANEPGSKAGTGGNLADYEFEDLIDKLWMVVANAAGAGPADLMREALGREAASIGVLKVWEILRARREDAIRKALSSEDGDKVGEAEARNMEDEIARQPRIKPASTEVTKGKWTPGQSTPLSIRIKKDIRAELEMRAASTGRTVSDIASALLEGAVMETTPAKRRKEWVASKTAEYKELLTKKAKL